jgi:GT2 family glycosyltransferase
MLTRFGSADLLEKCFSSLSNITTYRNFEVSVLVNNVSDSTLLQDYEQKWLYNFSYVDQPFNWSALNNIGARRTKGSVLLFLNDDIEVLEPNWLQYMLNLLDQPSIGVVGARLLYPNGLIQHTGISLVNYGGGARHPLRFCHPSEESAIRYAKEDREWSAVTGACLMVSRGLFDRLGGFDEAFPIIANDTDFCLRARTMGYRNVVAANARLIHHEGVSRAGIPEHNDVELFWRRWGHILKVPDPYMNPNFDMSRDDMVVAPQTVATLHPLLSEADYVELLRRGGEGS